MPLLSPNSVVILEGTVVLTQRHGSAKWQARFKAAGRWRRISTKAKELKDAKAAATELYLDARYRAKYGLPVQSKRFEDVARLTIERMKKELDGGEGRVVYRDYIQAIENYLIPFFRNRHIDTLERRDIECFSAWRIERMGREPTASTLGTHNSALRRIFDEAMMGGYMANSQVPVLENKGRAGQRRPDFGREEYRKLCRGLRDWSKKGRNGKSRAMRELLRDYVLILLKTGMRHGTEAQNLRWSQVSIFTEDGRVCVAMSVKGKTERRELVARHGCLPCLKRIHARCRDIAGVDFGEFMKSRSDLPVFRLVDGTTTKNLNQTFRAFLKEVGLLKHPQTGQNRTLYSLRHTYATSRLLAGTIKSDVLARQMGTSTAMLDKHYYHLEPRMKAKELAG